MCMLRQSCSLSMLYRTCEYLHGSVRLGGLDMAQWVVYLGHACLF